MISIASFNTYWQFLENLSRNFSVISVFWGVTQTDFWKIHPSISWSTYSAFVKYWSRSCPGNLPIRVKNENPLTGNMVQHTNDTTNETETINNHEKSFQLLIIRLSCELSPNRLENQPTKEYKILFRIKWPLGGAVAQVKATSSVQHIPAMNTSGIEFDK